MRQNPMRNLRFAVLFVCGLSAAACTSSDPEFRHAEEIDPIGMARFRQLDTQKAAYWKDGFTPRTFDWGANGSVEVTRWQLQGVPGDTYVKANFIWKNTGKEPVRHVFVTLYVLDADGNVEGASAVRLYNPAGYDLYPGDTVTSYVRADTGTVDLEDGDWSWAVQAEALIPDDPTAQSPPLIRNRRPGAPPPRGTYRGPIQWTER